LGQLAKFVHFIPQKSSLPWPTFNRTQRVCWILLARPDGVGFSEARFGEHFKKPAWPDKSSNP
jgi:hypothetical protein